jgi:hypothetical protein
VITSFKPSGILHMPAVRTAKSFNIRINLTSLSISDINSKKTVVVFLI